MSRPIARSSILGVSTAKSTSTRQATEGKNQARRIGVRSCSQKPLFSGWERGLPYILSRSRQPILTSYRWFYIILLVVAMYKLKLIRCPNCNKMFIAEPYQRICNECKELRRIEQYLKTHKQFAAFEEYTKPVPKIRCIICETETPLRRPKFRLYCRKCGALVYDPSIDPVPK